MKRQRPDAVLGMTLYNNAAHLREALDSLLSQTAENFVLLLLDDASQDETEEVARQYERRDSRVRYFKHQSRKAMVATWREVAEIAARDYQDARYFAWASDHDRWHPEWLRHLLNELERDHDAALAYPIAGWIDEQGEVIDKGGRLFDTAGCTDLRARWQHFCLHGVGAGNMVYGLIRMDSLRRAGVFRTVLRPDRLLVAELVLQGGFRQAQQVLWFRRKAPSSMSRQHSSLVLPDEAPYWFRWPPSIQHITTLHAEYSSARLAELGLSRPQWVRMLWQYQLAYAWRHTRKSDAADAFETTREDTRRAVRRLIRRTRYRASSAFAMSRVTAIEVDRSSLRVVHRTAAVARRLGKVSRRHWRIFQGRAASVWASMRRAGRRALYELLMLTHRTGLRGRGEKASR